MKTGSGSGSFAGSDFALRRQWHRTRCGPCTGRAPSTPPRRARRRGNDGKCRSPRCRRHGRDDCPSACGSTGRSPAGSTRTRSNGSGTGVPGTVLGALDLHDPGKRRVGGEESATDRAVTNGVPLDRSLDQLFRADRTVVCCVAGHQSDSIAGFFGEVKRLAVGTPEVVPVADRLESRPAIRAIHCRHPWNVRRVVEL